MAPTAPARSKRRTTARDKVRTRLAAEPLGARKIHRPDSVIDDGFIDSKRDKRTIRHSAFVARVQKSGSSSSGSGSANRTGKKVVKRRRPSKKLVANLESLGDALAEMQQDEAADDGGDIAADGSGAMDPEQARQGRVRHRSLRTRPGALKRKEKIVRGEIDRFGRSLAQLVSVSAGSGSGSGPSGMEGLDMDVAGGSKSTVQGVQEMQGTAPAASASTSNRWAALRSFISTTMEQNPAFLGKS